jgi:hypothetical protein
MPYDHVKPELLQIMSEYLLKGSQKLSKELYEFGDKTGKLSHVTILKMWNGVPLDGFSIKELEALFDFLNPKFNIGNAADYFSESPKSEGGWRQDTPMDSNRKQRYLETLSDPIKIKAEESLLKRVGENIEKIFCKDICEMSADELVAGFSNMGYINKRVARNELSAIKHYLEWCSNEGYYAPAYAEIQKISSDDIEIKKELMVFHYPYPRKTQGNYRRNKGLEWAEYR